MEKVIIDELPEETLFHFDYKKSIDKIEKEGLVAKIGENAIGIEKTPKVFFSKGELGIIKVTEVWLRWIMNRIYGPKDRLKKFKGLSKEENNRRLNEWTNEFLSEEYRKDSEKKEELFEYFYDYLKDRTYFTLDIKDGEEYSSTDIDENKEILNSPNTEKINKLFAKEMYGEFSDIDSNTMDDWNMHTKSGIGIESNKIKQVVTKDGKEDMLSIVLDVYEKNKDIEHSRFLIDDFVSYAKKRQELDKMFNEEGTENDKNNLCRKY